MSLKLPVFFCRNYYAPTQTFTVISATKQMWVLSSSRHVSLRMWERAYLRPKTRVRS